MIFIPLYILCLVTFGIYSGVLYRNRSGFHKLDFEQKSTVLSNSAQVLLISVGSMVGLYSLQQTIFGTQREQNIRTAAMFQNYDPESIGVRAEEYRSVVRLVFITNYHDVSSDSNSDGYLDTAERIDAVTKMWALGLRDDLEYLYSALAELDTRINAVFFGRLG